jgi:serine/threonine protein kinase
MVEMNNDGHFVFTVGCTIDRSRDFPTGRYIGKKLLGSGTYGVVVEGQDEKHNRARAAIKLVRRGSTLYREAALKEIRILRDLGGHCNTPQLLRDFEHQGHICMVFDLLGEDLLAILERSIFASPQSNCVYLQN